ncbi:hypothetical protein [Halorubrum sp. FL23]|uniref:hypothetical protein n=1 Tax=Halorubrum sp. FL23 TaxID=3458704 RepID=UPI004033D14B
MPTGCRGRLKSAAERRPRGRLAETRPVADRSEPERVDEAGPRWKGPRVGA